MHCRMYSKTRLEEEASIFKYISQGWRSIISSGWADLTAGGLGGAVSPPAGPGQSPGGGPGIEAPGSSLNLAFFNIKNHCFARL